MTLLLPLAAGSTQAKDNDDFGVWTEIGVGKRLTQTLDLGFEGEIRTGDNSTDIDRLSAGIKLTYKPLKFLKLGVGYSFYGDYSAEKTGKETFNGDGVLVGYRHTPSYWTPNHRFYVEGVLTKKYWKWLRVSLRERYQYTRDAETTVDRTDYSRDEYFDGENFTFGDWTPSANRKVNPAENQQRLRSRVKLEYDKKGVKWSPYVSVELYNGIDSKMHLHKVRTGVGSEYKINKQHKVGLAYLYTCHLLNDPNKHKHALNVSYGFDF